MAVPDPPKIAQHADEGGEHLDVCGRRRKARVLHFGRYGFAAARNQGSRRWMGGTIFGDASVRSIDALWTDRYR